MSRAVFEKSTDILFFCVNAFVALYILDDVLQILPLGREFGSLSFYVSFIGVPLAFALSLVARKVSGSRRFTNYAYISGLELALVLFVLLIVARSQV